MKKKILIVSSIGGHIDEVMQLAPVLEHHRVSLVVNDRCELPPFTFERVYRIAHAERDRRVLLNFAEAAAILLAEDPDILLSAGAGPVVPFAVLARVCGRPRIVYVETAAQVLKPSLTGRMMYRLAQDFFYQWPSLGRYFPRGRSVDLVFR